MYDETYYADPYATQKRPARRLGQVANPYQQTPDPSVTTQPIGSTAMPNGKPAPYQAQDPPLQGSQQPMPQPPQGVLASYDAQKLADPNHALKSPKYAWLQTAQNYANTPDGFQQAFAEVQRLFPQFFGNWQMEGDDSIRWTGEGQLNDAFQGHGGFDVWQNASGEAGTPSAWSWMSHTSPPDGGGGSLAALQQALAGMRAPSPLSVGGGGRRPAYSATPIGPDPLTSLGGGVWNGYSWVPKDHPEANLAPPPGAQSPGQPGSAPGGPTAEGLQQDLLMRLLQNPESMSDLTVAQLKEKQKEEALDMQRQLEQRLSTSAAARGVGGGGGELSGLRRIGEATNESILLGNREIDLAKNARDRQDQLGVLSLAESLRARGSDEDFRLQDLALREALGHKGLDIQSALGSGGLDLDRARLGESGRQFDLGHQLALQNFYENSRQFNDQLGYNYGVLNYNASMDPLKLLLSLFP